MTERPIPQPREGEVLLRMRLAVYEEDGGKTFVAYDRFSSLLHQYQHVEIIPFAQLVEQKLASLVAEATGGGEGKEP